MPGEVARPHSADAATQPMEAEGGTCAAVVQVAEAAAGDQPAAKASV